MFLFCRRCCACSLRTTYNTIQMRPWTAIVLFSNFSRLLLSSLFLFFVSRAFRPTPAHLHYLHRGFLLAIGNKTSARHTFDFGRKRELLLEKINESELGQDEVNYESTHLSLSLLLLFRFLLMERTSRAEPTGPVCLLLFSPSKQSFTYRIPSNTFLRPVVWKEHSDMIWYISVLYAGKHVLWCNSPGEEKKRQRERYHLTQKRIRPPFQSVYTLLLETLRAS